MEMDDLNKEDFVVNSNKLNTINDYFSFDSDDIELSYIKRNIDNNLKLHHLNKKHKEEAEEYFLEAMNIFDKANFSDLSFPYLKQTLSPILLSLRNKLNDQAQKSYFLILIFSNLSRIRTKLYTFYNENFKKHSLGLPKTVEGIMNPDLFESDHYSRLLERLSNWYVKNEFIFFYLQFLNDYFDIRINFNEKDFSIENNYEFSLKIFMKKSFYKLSGYLLNKLSVYSKSFFINRAMSTVNSKYMSFLLLSTLTYGISLKKITEVDVKPFIVLAGFFLHYLFNVFADSLEKQSNYVEIDNMSEILRKLNKKVEKLRLGLFDLIKANIGENVDIDENSKSKSKEKILKISQLINKYLMNVEEMEVPKLTELDFDYTEKIVKDNELSVSGDWMLITLSNEGKKYI